MADVTRTIQLDLNAFSQAQERQVKDMTRALDRNVRAFKALESVIKRNSRALHGYTGGVRSANRSTRKFMSSLRAFSRIANSVAFNIRNAGRALFSWRTLFIGALGGSALMAGKRALVDYNMEMQNFQFGISMTINQMVDWERYLGKMNTPQKRWNDSMGMSIILVDRLRRAAAAGIGTMDDYVEAFQLLSPAVLGAGGSVLQAERMTKLMVPLAKAAKKDPATAAYDVQQLMRGEAGGKQINLPFLKGVAKDVANMAKSNPMEALKMLETEMKKAKYGAEAYGSTFEAQMETAIDSLKKFAGDVGRPFFGELNKYVTEFNKNWVHTRSLWMELGEKLGEKLVWVLRNSRELATGFAEKMSEAAQAAMRLTKVMVIAKTVGFFGAMGAQAGIIGANALASGGAARSVFWGSRAAYARRKMGIKGLPGPSMKGPKGSSMPIRKRPTPADLKNVGKLRGLAGIALGPIFGTVAALTVMSGRAQELSKRTDSLGESARSLTGLFEGLGKGLMWVMDKVILFTGKVVQSFAWMSRQAASGITFYQGGTGPSNRTMITNEDAKSFTEAKERIERPFRQVRKDWWQQAEKLIEADPSKRAEVLMTFASAVAEARKVSPFADKMLGKNPNALSWFKGKQVVPGWTSGGTFPGTMKSATEALMLINNQRFPKGERAKGRSAFAAGLTQLEEETPYIINRMDRIFQKSMKPIEDRILDKKGKPPDLNFNNNTFILNQDFRGKDPDAIMVMFREDIGKIAASSVQSKLAVPHSGN